MSAQLKRSYNFYPGPAALPFPVLEEIRDGLLDYQESGMSVMEMSHRSPAIEELLQDTEELLKDLLAIPDGYRVLFLQGGASTQFYLIPFNFLPERASADYVVTGSFAEKAYEEAAKVGAVRIAASSREKGYRCLPDEDSLDLDPKAAYLHITSNNTAYGTQWHSFPDCGDTSLICDMSSDLLSRRIDIEKFALVYAGAQKNLGQAGVTVLIIREKMLAKVPASLPNMMRYDIHAAKKSLYNTPPTFPIYTVNLVLKWMKDSGGLAVIEARNQQKAKLLYDLIDGSGGFYTGYADKESRSLMNITFKLPQEEMTKKFITEAAEAGLIGLKGYRSVGGIRASIYNAVSLEGCDALAGFMKKFQKRQK